MSDLEIIDIEIPLQTDSKVDADKRRAPFEFLSETEKFDKSLTPIANTILIPSYL